MRIINKLKNLILLCSALAVMSSCGSEGSESDSLTQTATDTASSTSVTTSAPETTTTSAAATTSTTSASATTTTTAAAATTTTTTSATTTTTTTTVTTTAAATKKPADTTSKVTAAPVKKPPAVTAKAAVFYCYDTGEVLFSKDTDKRISLASITKLLTASVALENLGADHKITVGSEIKLVHPNSTLAYLSEGCRMPLSDLLYGLLLPSGNDAAYTLAVNTARAAEPDKALSDKEAVAVFVGMMNDYAAKLGMKSSHFANPEGWDDPGHYTTVSDLMKLVDHALGKKEIRDAAATLTKTVRFETGGYAVWKNTNRMLDPSYELYDKTASGLKTGTTDAAGSCVAEVFVRGGKTYVCIVMGCSSRYQLYTQVRDIASYYGR